MPKKHRLKSVTSGLAFDVLALGDKGATVPSGEAADAPKHVTSHFARVLLAGAGFLADAYDLFVINLVLRLLRDEFPEYASSDQIQQFEGCVASAALFGSMFGQIVAGNLADIIGRKILFVTTAILITIGSFLSASTFDSSSFPIYYKIALCRFILGVGVGGEYPLAATVTSESSSAKSRGSLMCAVFAMQGVGSLLSVLIVMFCLSMGFSTNTTWRVSLAFGAVPVIIAFPWRLYMHETETFEQVKQNRIDCEEYDRTYGSMNNLVGLDSSQTPPAKPTYSRWEEMKQAMSLFKWHLLGTSGCWYLLDVDFYGNGLFNHDVTATILSHGKPTTAMQDAFNSMIICLIGMPGYFICVYMIDKVGRKTIQFRGFIVMAILFAICGNWYEWFLDPNGSEIRKYLFLIIYAFTFLFSNFGPNSMTFVIPGEIFPPEVKATCHGLSAACGKLGGASGALIFPYLMNMNGAKGSGMSRSMFTCSLVALLGAILTYYFTPSYGQEELEDVECLYPLEHSCFKLSDEQMGTLLESKRAKSAPYEMYEIVEYIDDDNNEALVGNYLDIDKDEEEKGNPS